MTTKTQAERDALKIMQAETIERVKQLVDCVSLSKKQVAQLLGIGSMTMLYSYINGESLPNERTCRAIMEAFEQNGERILREDAENRKLIAQGDKAIEAIEAFYQKRQQNDEYTAITWQKACALAGITRNDVRIHKTRYKLLPFDKSSAAIRNIQYLEGTNYGVVVGDEPEGRKEHLCASCARACYGCPITQHGNTPKFATEEGSGDNRVVVECPHFVRDSYCEGKEWMEGVKKHPKHMNDFGMVQLTAAIAGQAVKDWEASLRKLKTRQYHGDVERDILISTMRQCEAFITGEVFEKLTNLDGHAVIESLHRKHRLRSGVI